MKKKSPGPQREDAYGARVHVVSGVIGCETLRLLLIRAKKNKVTRTRAVGDIIRERLHGRDDARVFNASKGGE